MLIQPCKREMITDVKDNHAYQPGNVSPLKIIVNTKLACDTIILGRRSMLKITNLLDI